MNAFTKGRKQALKDGEKREAMGRAVFYLHACEQAGKAYTSNKARAKFVDGYEDTWGDLPTAEMKAVKR